MGEEHYMHQQLLQKLAEGFNCIKLKIGAIDFNTELKLLSSVRDRYGSGAISLRVDANGAFNTEQAKGRLASLAQYAVHSIEQPIPAGNWEAMQELCRETPVPIALDEELIGIHDFAQKEELLRTIMPQYLVLKPSLVGGFAGSLEWITLAEKFGVGWWVTSALESNIGLNAIAQWVATLKTDLPQGLGTGGLFTNNFDSPLQVAEGCLYYRNNLNWNTNLIRKLCI
jgi:L-alanine-DL-glutamate epimerase-like enolase superfamily enzyme